MQFQSLLKLQCYLLQSLLQQSGHLALKQCQNISAISTPGKRTIVTLDLQLYIKAVQLVSTRSEMKGMSFVMANNMHILQRTGPFEESSLDSLFIQCGIFGPNVLDKILKGKHMVRCNRFYLKIYWKLYDISSNSSLNITEKSMNQ